MALQKFIFSCCLIFSFVISSNLQANKVVTTNTYNFTLNKDSLSPGAKYVYQLISSPPDSLHLDPFYKQYISAVGIPIVSSEKVPPTALLTARDILCYMLAGRSDIRAELERRGARLLIMASTEMETDLPEHSHWKKPAIDDPRLTPREREQYYEPGGIASMTDKGYWNQRARGMGGLITSAAEENLLAYPGTRYYGENITIHEFSHNMMGAIRRIDKPLYGRILAAYKAARDKGMYKGQYAINTADEYFAEGTQWWFWSNFPFTDLDRNITIWSPASLKKYDPVLYQILSEIYIGHHNPGDAFYKTHYSPGQGSTH